MRFNARRGLDEGEFDKLPARAAYCSALIRASPLAKSVLIVLQMKGLYGKAHRIVMLRKNRIKKLRLVLTKH